MRLLSNFVDYYDHHFDLSGEVFDRRNNIGMDRKEMFQFFDTLGLKTPFHGTLEEVFAQHQKAIVYLNLTSHSGNDKVLIDRVGSWEFYKDCFASEFIPTHPYPFISISYRYLQIGSRNWLLRYMSSNDWRSNSGEVAIELFSEGKPGKRLKIPYPLFAIDFVRDTQPLAIDFNQSPGLKGTGIEDILKPQEVVDLIKGAVNAKIMP